ncbi:MAG: hypothetical protein KBS65_03175 [Prevotella sp.]|nr:hypothetical protein [Candidatus Equicola stercoris]
MNKRTTDKDIAHLLLEVEKRMGYSFKTPKHFALCREDIITTTKSHISISTLKRMWGYVSVGDKYVPNLFTLNILAKFVGYYDYNDFKRSYIKINQNDEAKSLMQSISSHVEILQKEIAHLNNLLNKE